MRVRRSILVVLATIFIAGALSRPASADVSFDFFYSDLGPHGSWSVSGSYGRVWQPSVYSSDWNPYLDGHWVYTDLGWTWVSDYDWGDVCYHYGTWTVDPALGWVWVPGYVWAPSWVVFRTGPDYIGWAPVPPEFSIGVSFDGGRIEANRFVFVSTSNFEAPRIRSIVVPRSQTTVIVNRTRIVNNIRIENNVVVNRGPDVREIERVSGRKIAPVPMERVPHAAPGGGFRREAVRVDGKVAKRGLRAAEPESGNEPLPQDRTARLGRSPVPPTHEERGAPGKQERQKPASGEAARRPEAGQSPSTASPKTRPIEPAAPAHEPPRVNGHDANGHNAKGGGTNVQKPQPPQPPAEKRQKAPEKPEARSAQRPPEPSRDAGSSGKKQGESPAEKKPAGEKKQKEPKNGGDKGGKKPDQKPESKKGDGKDEG